MEMIRKAMKLRILKRFGAVGLAAALALTAMLIPKIGLSAKAAQPEESESRVKGLQGAWRVQVTVRDCQTGAAQRTFPALFTFAKGGTLSVTTAGQPPAISTTGLGVWRHTDDHAYSAVSETFIFNSAGVWTQTHRLTRAIEIGDNGDEFTDTIALAIFDTNGNVIVTGCGTTVGSRFANE
jgi:hypothetical protein